MNRDHSIVSVSCLICQEYRVIHNQQRIGRTGFALVSPMKQCSRLNCAAKSSDWGRMKRFMMISSNIMSISFCIFPNLADLCASWRIYE